MHKAGMNKIKSCMYDEMGLESNRVQSKQLVFKITCYFESKYLFDLYGEVIYLLRRSLMSVKGDYAYNLEWLMIPYEQDTIFPSSNMIL